MDGRDGFIGIEFNWSDGVIKDDKEFVVLPLAGIHYMGIKVAGGVGISGVLFGRVDWVGGAVVPGSLRQRDVSQVIPVGDEADELEAGVDGCSTRKIWHISRSTKPSEPIIPCAVNAGLSGIKTIIIFINTIRLSDANHVFGNIYP